eukprot:Pgem_evm1s14926
MFDERKIIETEDEEPNTFTKTWYEARATYPGIAQMVSESIGNKMMDWVGGTLLNTIQLINNKDDGLTKDVRVEKSIYGLCRRACKLCSEKEQWKAADLKTAVKEEGERALRQPLPTSCVRYCPSVGLPPSSTHL